MDIKFNEIVEGGLFISFTDFMEKINNLAEGDEVYIKDIPFFDSSIECILGEICTIPRSEPEFTVDDSIGDTIYHLIVSTHDTLGRFGVYLITGNEKVEILPTIFEEVMYLTDRFFVGVKEDGESTTRYVDFHEIVDVTDFDTIDFGELGDSIKFLGIVDKYNNLRCVYVDTTEVNEEYDNSVLLRNSDEMSSYIVSLISTLERTLDISSDIADSIKEFGLDICKAFEGGVEQ